MTTALDQPVTVGEIARRLDRMTARLDQLPDAADLQAVAGTWLAQLQSTDTRVEELQRRITHLEEWQTWALRIIVGALLGAAAVAGFTLT